jgi:transcriptional regulator with XRE-family HTH domain
MGLSMSELAERIGISNTCKGYISRVENDKNEPKIERLREIATALNCHVGDLLDTVISNSIPSTPALPLEVIA